MKNDKETMIKKKNQENISKRFSRFFFNLQPKGIDRADVVGEASASE